MKKLLLTLLLFAVIGCSAEEIDRMQRRQNLLFYGADVNDAEWGKIIADRRAMLTDGRIYIGMTEYRFARLWGRDIYPDRSTSAYGVTEWWKFSYSCQPCGWGGAHYIFSFDDGILTYWSEN